ncbi:HET-domain-containing protein, partial [Hyaloscypha hepaticicola]
MWLIETESLKLEYFLGKDIPCYAILSHTWGDGEASFQDWQDLRKASQKTGFAKIKSACAQARDDGLRYIWVDTNCIDKSSSAELSEAINSMFAWYKNSWVCYVYLADVKDPEDVAGNLDSLRKSRWFTRGWTLQELLAPTSIRFFTQDWKPISMESRHYSQLVSSITGIRLDVLSYPQNVMSCSNVEKMSWIAGRETTREEDVAYCLLGIFDINMPLLYGEGRKAFARLQEEIIKQSTDHSLFAW